MTDPRHDDESLAEELLPLFERVAPRGAPQELRERVLSAVAQELASTPRRAKPRWERICEWSVAAALLLGVGLQLWRSRAEQEFQLRVFGPPPESSSSEVFAAVESATDRQTARQMSDRLKNFETRGDAREADHAYRRLIEELTHELQGTEI